MMQNDGFFNGKTDLRATLFQTPALTPESV